MPPPIKTPKPATTAEQTLVTFAKNLEEIRRWYRSAATPGHEAGHNVMAELLISDVSLALELAIKGKAWERPLSPP